MTIDKRKYVDLQWENGHNMKSIKQDMPLRELFIEINCD